jgi:GTP cyclohydrolase IA
MRITKENQARAEYHVKQALELLGHDTDTEEMLLTPKRFIKFLKDYTVVEPFKFTVFKAETTGMIVQDNIPFTSVCAHHLLPFFGHVTVGYIPNPETMAGISKLGRSVKMFARQLQNQERITRQVVEHLQQNLKPLGCGCVITAQHMCMCMRGVEMHDVYTTTTELQGVFKNDSTSRQEFLAHHNYHRYK